MVVKGIPNILFRYNLWRSIYPILVANNLHICLAYQNLRKNNLGFIPCHNAYGVDSTDYDGALFSVKAIVSKA